MRSALSLALAALLALPAAAAAQGPVDPAVGERFPDWVTLPRLADGELTSVAHLVGGGTPTLLVEFASW